MKLIVELWGDIQNLSIGEIRGIFEGEEIPYKIIIEDYPIILLEAENGKSLQRAGLIRRVSQHLYSGRDIPRLNLYMEDYVIRVRRREKNIGPKNIERILAKGIEGSVDLKNPKNVIRVYIASNIHVGLEIFEVKSEEFEKRKAKNLPISYPITMHPRLARAMVNLARVKEGSKIIDPFCGTGSILIEAGLMGMQIYGSDIDLRMIDASEINLRKFGLKAYLKVSDVGGIEGKYDAVVTDPPYGRSSSTKGESIYSLYERAFKKFSEITEKVVIALPDKRAINIGEKYFHLREVYPIRVHKSLTRYFSYYQK